MNREFEIMPLVTVYIPTYNRVDLLKRAVNSVLTQTYKNFEIIIVDDNSSDGTQEYLNTLALKDTRVHCYFKEKNSGACVSRNIAINNAKGEYITGLDDDDYFLENRLENFVKNIHLLDEYQFIFSNMLFERNGKFKKRGWFRPKIITMRHLVYGNYVGNQIFCATKIIKNIQGFDENLKAWQDLDCWYRLLENKKKAYFIGFNDYVVDDNDRVRITNQDKEIKFREVYNYLVLKYKFNLLNKCIFSTCLLGYGIRVRFIYIFLISIVDYKFYTSLWYWKRLANNCLRYFFYL